MICREEDAAIPKYCKDDERQSAQKIPQKAWFVFFPYSILVLQEPNEAAAVFCGTQLSDESEKSRFAAFGGKKARQGAKIVKNRAKQGADGRLFCKICVSNLPFNQISNDSTNR